MKNILFPTDFSDNSWSALVYTLKLYAQKECEFYLFNTTHIESNDLLIDSNHFIDSTSEHAEELLKLKKLAEDSDANANHSFRIILSSEQLDKAIAIAAKKYTIDLIAMGTQGADLSKKSTYYSNTVNIIHTINQCPILVVPEAYDYIPIDQIALLTEFKEPYLDRHLTLLKKLSNNSKIHVIYSALGDSLDTLQNYNKTELENLLSDYDCKFHWLSEASNELEAIHMLIKKNEINMLTLFNSEHKLIKTPLTENLINEIVYDPIVPLLVIPD